MPAPARTQLIDPGKKAPAFALKDQQSTTRRLSQYAGQWVILYFYPKDNTSGCTKEACAFRDMLLDFSAAGAVVLGVSPDDENSHVKFTQKHDLPFALLADPEHQALTRYGVWQEKSMYGRKYMGVVRTTYLINPKGKVAHRWDKVKITHHVQTVLEALTDLQHEK